LTTIQEIILGAGPNDATVVDECHVVADAVQLGGDVRREQDTVSLANEKARRRRGWW
jgi:hypothetical protein